MKFIACKKVFSKESTSLVNFDVAEVIKRDLITELACAMNKQDLIIYEQDTDINTGETTCMAGVYIDKSPYSNWVYKGFGQGHMCMNCGYTNEIPTKYCPDCGKKNENGGNVMFFIGLFIFVRILRGKVR